jgi:hypothetical protein
LALHGRADDVHPATGTDTFDWRADDNALKHVVPNELVQPAAQHPVLRHVDRPYETGGQPLAEEVRDRLGHEGGVFDVIDPGLAAAPPDVWTDGPGMQPRLATVRAACREIAASGYELNSSAPWEHWHGLLLVGQDERLARLVVTLRQNPLTQAGLTLMKVTTGAGAEWVPRRDVPVPNPAAQPRDVPFGSWWRTTVTKDSAGGTWNRYNMVWAIANKEGGAHVDPNQPIDVRAIEEKNSMAWTYHDPIVGDKPMSNGPLLPSIRQIAYELEHTMRTHLGEELGLPT